MRAGDSRLRRAWSFPALIAVLALGSLTLGQCRMVNDRLTGVSVDTFGRQQANTCIIGCTSVAAAALQDEGRLHSANIRACNGNSSCIQTENARHQSAVATITAALHDCIGSCHHQGGGDGGP